MNNIFKLLNISILTLLSICSCHKPYDFKEELKKKLNDLPSIVEINQINLKNDDFKCAFEVFFEVPLDWNNVDGEKLKQRVVIDAKSFDLPTIVELQGYNIGDKYINDGFVRELPTLTNSNFVVIEHRFFAKSSYSGANYEDANGWEQLTVKNAAHDHNFIISELRKIFNKKWAATGSSKGGYITNCLACLYPETCDVYVPYVAPCLSQYDSRPSYFINNEAGDSTYGKQEAKIIRDNILKFQVFCFEHKKELIDILFSEKYSPASSLYRQDLSNDNLFDINMLDFSYGLWQYGYCKIEDINSFILLPENNIEEINTKINKAVELIIEGGGSMTNVSYNTNTYPYFITAYKEMGNYEYNYSYLLDMAESLGKSIKISLPKGKETEFSIRCYLSDSQIKNIQYDSTMYNTLINWIQNENLKTKIIMINGQEDPWFHGSLPLPTKLGENIKVFTHPFSNHRVQITQFDKTTQKQIMDYLYSWLDIKLQVEVMYPSHILIN